MELITSISNPKIKKLRSLRNARARRESGLCLVEGIWHTGEAVAAWREGRLAGLDSVFYAPGLLTSQYANDLVKDLIKDGASCHPVTAEVFQSISGKENPQGILAVVSSRQASLEDLDPHRHPWLVALVEPQDPGNIGTILRTLDAVGASGLLILEGGADEYQPECIRASMGTIFWYPVVRTTFEKMVAWARQGGYTLYGSSAHATQEFSSVINYERPCILVLGSERQGLIPEQQDACQHMLKLPMHGWVTSLNLAVAVGILLYHMREH